MNRRYLPRHCSHCGFRPLPASYKVAEDAYIYAYSINATYKLFYETAIKADHSFKPNSEHPPPG